MGKQYLTKSRYIAGLQCPRRLWLLVHRPLPYEAPAPGSPMNVGQEIGQRAHLLFPGGAHFGMTVANFLAIYACMFEFFRDANFPAAPRRKRWCASALMNPNRCST